MDNKLSELSNPAWIVGQQEIDDFMRGDEALLVRGYDPESTEPALRVYSQEYVSALDGVAQYWIGESAGWKKRAEDAEKRIAELERANTSQDDHINQQQDRIDSLEKTNTGLGRRLGDAEKRLATPVRLPDIRQSSSGDRYQWPDGAHNYRLDVISMLLGAGFTVALEGVE